MSNSVYHSTNHFLHFPRWSSGNFKVRWTFSSPSFDKFSQGSVHLSVDPWLSYSKKWKGKRFSPRCMYTFMPSFTSCSDPKTFNFLNFQFQKVSNKYLLSFCSFSCLRSSLEGHWWTQTAKTTETQPTSDGRAKGQLSRAIQSQRQRGQRKMCNRQAGMVWSQSQWSRRGCREKWPEDIIQDCKRPHRQKSTKSTS